MARGIISRDGHGVYVAVFPHTCHPTKKVQIYRPVPSPVFLVVPNMHYKPIAAPPRQPCPEQSCFEVGAEVDVRFYGVQDAYAEIALRGQWRKSTHEHWHNHSITEMWSCWWSLKFVNAPALRSEKHFQRTAQ